MTHRAVLVWTFVLTSILTAARGGAASAGTPAAPAQVTFEQAVQDLRSPDSDVRLRTLVMLKDAAYVEAAVPAARLVNDPNDDVQLAAIAAELNIFLAEKIVAKKRVALVVEVRSSVAADAAFTAGPSALGSAVVPNDVLTALRTAARDDNPRVALEALYAFGALGVSPGGAARRELLRTAGPDLAAMIGAADPMYRYGAVRVIGRLFERRASDPPIETALGDAVISVLNDRDNAMRLAAMQTLGALRYERSVQGLMDMFQYYGKGPMAEAALDAVAHIGHPTSVRLLASQLTSKAPALRGIAIEGLTRAAARTELPDIQASLRGERSEALLLAGAFAAVMLSDGSIDPLIDALARPKLREQARGYLAEAAPGRIRLFARRLQDPDARVRADLADALGGSEDPAALGLLTPMTADPDTQVARAVARAVARLEEARRTTA